MYEKIIEKINNADKILIFSHINPDGDAIGSSAALKLALESLGKKADIVIDSHIPENLDIFGVKILGYEDVKGEYDLNISLDSSDMKRLGRAAEYFKGNTALIDHHGTNVRYAEECVVVPGGAAAGELVYDLLEEMGITPDIPMANALYAAMMTDTGGFMHQSTQPSTHVKAARLMELGAEFMYLNRKLNVEKSYREQIMNAYCVERMEFYEDGKICLSYFDHEFCASHYLDNESISGLSSKPVSVKGVETGIFISEIEKDIFKVSMRSVEKVNVASISVFFGGGGHIRAAGFIVENYTYKDLKNKLLELTIEQLSE